MSFAGRILTSSGAAVSGNYCFEFKLCAAKEGGTCSWTERSSRTAPTAVYQDGSFFAVLGTTNPIESHFTGSIRYLDVSIDLSSDCSGQWESFVTRIPISSVPYAFHANNAARAASAATADTAAHANTADHAKKADQCNQAATATTANHATRATSADALAGTIGSQQLANDVGARLVATGVETYNSSSTSRKACHVSWNASGTNAHARCNGYKFECTDGTTPIVLGSGRCWAGSQQNSHDKNGNCYYRACVKQ